MFADHHAILPDDDPLGIGMHIDRTTNGSRQDRVFVVVEPHRAGLRDGGRHAVEAIEAADIGHQMRAFGLEHLPDRLVGLFHMAVRLGVGHAFVQQPGVQLVQTLHPQPRCEEPFSHQPDLVLDLTLLPTGRRGAGDGLDKIVAAHLQEAAVVMPLFASEDRLHSRLHVVVDAPRAGALEEGKGSVMRIEHHLLALAHIGPGEHHPAVAEPDMGHLDRHSDARDHHDLLAPIELVSLARCIVERHIGFRRYRAPVLRPALGEPAHGIVPALVAQPAQLLKDADQRQPFPRRLASVGR